MYASQHGTSTTSAGVNIAVEANYEWQIQEIAFDGTEKYLKPPSYFDHVAKLARKVDWRGLIGADATYDNPDALPRFASDEEEFHEEKETKPQLEVEGRKGSDAGPWHSVAKNLHEALQQINVLVDTMSVLKTSYLEALTVADTFEMQHNIQDVIQQSKQFQWITKRKALNEASAVLENSLKHRVKLNSEIESEKELFFRELKKMREHWRVRKTGNVVFGDLGYKIYAPKYNPKEIFEITRRSSTNASCSTQSESSLQVIVPCDLARRATISVSIEIDDMNSNDLFSVVDNDLDYMKVDPLKIMEVPWSSALSWAQETLICRDIFSQLSEDAIILQDRIAVVRDGVLIVSLFDNILLKVQLSFYPFERGPLINHGDEYLTRTLRQIFLNDVCYKAVRNQTFVAMPLTMIPDSFDLRGPLAFTDQEIQSRLPKKRLLLQRLIATAAHQLLVNKVVNTLENLLLQKADPQISWKWLRCGAMQSCAVVSAANRSYDYAGKTTFYIRIDSADFYVSTKEGQRIDCKRDERLLTHTINYLICNYMLNTVAMIASKLWQWQILHANINAVDENGEASPTIYLCNQNSTCGIFIQFHLQLPPTIRVRNNLREEELLNVNHADFIVINYNKLVGTSLCRKIDYLCEIMRN